MKKIRISAKQVIGQNGCELEAEVNGERIFIKVFFDPDSIWVDTNALPSRIFFEAINSQEDLIEGKCGEKDEDIIRKFINIDWIIDEIGEPQKLIDELIFQRYNILNMLPSLKKKFLRLETEFNETDYDISSFLGGECGGPG